MRRIIACLTALFLFTSVTWAADSTEVKTQTTKPAVKADTTGAKVKPAEPITTKSGLKYTDVAVGKGQEAKAGDMVEVHYTGWLYENGKKGTKFDSSRDRNQPFKFLLGAHQVITGWDEGVAGMKIGGKRELIIPPALAYGSRGAGGVIPANATLWFDVELLAVTPMKSGK
jgi:FKBP-type peptidyl-prolyl cis-trans isomerase